MSTPNKSILPPLNTQWSWYLIEVRYATPQIDDFSRVLSLSTSRSTATSKKNYVLFPLVKQQHYGTSILLGKLKRMKLSYQVSNHSSRVSECYFNKLRPSSENSIPSSPHFIASHLHHSQQQPLLYLIPSGVSWGLVLPLSLPTSLKHGRVFGHFKSFISILG